MSLRDKRYLIQSIEPADPFKVIRTQGGSNNLSYSISRCKQLAEDNEIKEYLLFYRVIERREGEVLFISLVNFDSVEHFDMRDKDKDE